jgi:hypothetical protein
MTDYELKLMNEFEAQQAGKIVDLSEKLWKEQKRNRNLRVRLAVVILVYAVIVSFQFYALRRSTKREMEEAKSMQKMANDMTSIVNKATSTVNTITRFTTELRIVLHGFHCDCTMQKDGSAHCTIGENPDKQQPPPITKPRSETDSQL